MRRSHGWWLVVAIPSACGGSEQLSLNPRSVRGGDAGAESAIATGGADADPGKVAGASGADSASGANGAGSDVGGALGSSGNDSGVGGSGGERASTGQGGNDMPGTPGAGGACSAEADSCQVCNVDADCEDEGFCLLSRSICVECRSTTDCRSLSDVCDPITLTCELACEASRGCEAEDETPFCAERGVCVECLTDTDCEEEQRCDPVANTCRECLTDADCGPDAACERSSGECEGS